MFCSIFSQECSSERCRCRPDCATYSHASKWRPTETHLCLLFLTQNLSSRQSQRVTTDIQTRTAMKTHTCGHGALCKKLGTCSTFIFQKLIKTNYRRENVICCIAEGELFKSYPKMSLFFQFPTELLNKIFINFINAASPVQLIFPI